MTHKTVVLPKTGKRITLVPRSQLRASSKAKRLVKAGRADGLPTAPAKWSGKSRSAGIDLPILGNDEYGDCFYAAICHIIQLWAGSVGGRVDYNADEVVKFYLALSGGDNGLSDDQALPELVRGPCGMEPHAEDWAILDSTDPAYLSDIGYEFCGLLFTLAIPDTWLQVAEPGAVWDGGRGVRPDPMNGHAVILSGRDDGWDLETWGFDKPVHLTDSGVKVCDPEFIAAVGRPALKNGQNWHGRLASELVSSWAALGGGLVYLGPDGPGPGPDPGPADVVIKAGEYLVTLAGDATFKAVTGAATVAELVERVKGWTLADLVALMQAILALLQSMQKDPVVMTGGVKKAGGGGPHPVVIGGGAGAPKK